MIATHISSITDDELHAANGELLDVLALLWAASKAVDSDPSADATHNAASRTACLVAMTRAKVGGVLRVISPHV